MVLAGGGVTVQSRSALGTAQTQGLDGDAGAGTPLCLFCTFPSSLRSHERRVQLPGEPTALAEVPQVTELSLVS